MDINQETYRWLERREKQGKQLSSSDLTDWCGDSRDRWETLLTALEEGTLAWHQEKKAVIDYSRINWGKPSMGEGPHEGEKDSILTQKAISWETAGPAPICDVMDEIESSGISPTDDIFSRRVFEMLMERDGIMVTVADFRKWLREYYPPNNLIRQGKYSKKLKTLDEAYYALYVESSPLEMAHDEKKRIVDWLDDHYDICTTLKGQISAILNPRKFSNDKIPNRKK